jgi:PII-like signaling protein
VSVDALKLTVYIGEHQRLGRTLLSDALLDLYQRHELEAAVLLRGIEGFGAAHTLHTQRLLTLSEDLPLVSIAVDRRETIEAALPEVSELVGKGLVTLERARLLAGAEPPVQGGATVKLTVYCGRAERIGSRSAAEAAIELLHARGVSGATAFLGVDGMRHGVRQRARFFSGNADVPVMIVAVGSEESTAAVLPELGALLERPLVTSERIEVCKRDGVGHSEPPATAENDDAGLAVWQKLSIYAGESARHGGHALHSALIRRLRAEGAAGATALRGILGYSGDHPPHGERLLSLRRTAPVVTVVIDRPEPMRRWWRIVDELTDEHGLVTSELVPASHAVGEHGARGGLRLSRSTIGYPRH